MDGTPDDNFSLSSVFSQSYFEIPEYQRDYAWEKRNVNDLLDDIEFVYEQNNDNDRNDKLDHYFGTIVLEDRGTTEPTDYEDYDVYGTVDGQQRLATVAIIISSIVDEMSDLEERGSINPDFKSTIEQEKNKIADNYIEYKGTERMKLGGLGERAYNEVIIEDISPEKFLEKDGLVEAGRKITRAKQVSSNRLKRWKDNRFKSDSLDSGAYYKFLKNLVRILTQRFKVNVKVVEDVDEAARMFKVINDRGRDLRLHDKIRSHLVYCASQSTALKSKEIYTQFNDIVRNVTTHDGFSDEEVDDLARIHWKVFTSERSDTRSKRDGPNEIHRRLSEYEDFASIQRDNVENFINPYLDSLERFSEKYPFLTDRDKFAEKYYRPDKEINSTINQSVQRIQLLFLHTAVQSATSPLLISTAEKYGVESEEFSKITEELEKLVFGYSLVMSNGVQGFKNTLSSIANDLYWSGIDRDDIRRIFCDDNDRYTGYKHERVGIQESFNRIEEKRKKLSPMDKVTSQYLKTPNVIDGGGTSGWGGVRNNEVIKYIMYEYERDLRDRSGLLNLSPYHEFRKNFDVEHLVPKEAKGRNRLESHAQHRNRIGNLAVLSSSQNKSEGNNTFTSKYNTIYKDSSLKLLSELNGPEFTVEDIEGRENRLLGFIGGRWK